MINPFYNRKIIKRKEKQFLIVGLCTASVALFTSLDIVVDMISIGTLMVFYLVANALVYRRYVITSKNPPPQILLFLFLLSSSAIGLSLSWKFKQQGWGLPVFGGFIFTIISFFHYNVPCHSHPSGWSMPFMPWLPSLSIVLNIFLMATLKLLSFQRFAIWACLITLFYLLYGVHSTYQAEEMEMDIDGDVNLNSSMQQSSKLDSIQVL